LAFDQPPGVQALTFMSTLLTERLANPVILKNDELLAKDDFLSGRAAFTSQWFFLQYLLDDPQVSGIVKQAKITLLPASKTVAAKTSSVSAYQGIAMLATSGNEDAAWQWVRFLTGPLVQRAFMFEMPIWKSVQTSQDAKLLDPLMPIKREQLLTAHQRLMLPNQLQTTAILQNYLHLALRGKMEPAAALKQAKAEIENLSAETP
jgi:multiple sugar transport system substrate-binding protein